ncbi:MAG: HlyC/CorC family transporter [Burkholderiales bacterium]|nr:HlyC/CorC family transporter [Anaerolineae bacterium]
METILGLLAIALLVGMNGFFVAAEFSLVGARRTRIDQLAAEGNTGAIAAKDAIDHLDSYIAATQLGITLASLGLGWIGEPAIAHLFEPVLHALLPPESVETVGHTITIVIAFALVTMLHIVFGELAPKTIALQRPEQTSMLVARPTTWFLRLFRPVIQLMNGIGNAVVRALGFDPAQGHTNVHSAEELEMLVASSREAGLLQASEEILLRRVFDFSDIQVHEIMQPRVEVYGIAADMPLPDVLILIAENHHSRYPVYEDTIDSVTGVLHTKDLLDLLIARPQLLQDSQDFKITEIMRTPLFVPETATSDKLLELMQKTKMHLAVIVGEHGGMSGVVTMEDIIEQLVGEVQDEFDQENSPIRYEGDIALVDGLVSVHDIEERFGEPEGRVYSATIGGYVAERLGRIPKEGDTVPFGDYDVRVETMEGLRVAKVRFIRRENTETAESKPPVVIVKVDKGSGQARE